MLGHTLLIAEERGCVDWRSSGHESTTHGATFLLDSSFNTIIVGSLRRKIVVKVRLNFLVRYRLILVSSAISTGSRRSLGLLFKGRTIYKAIHSVIKPLLVIVHNTDSFRSQGNGRPEPTQILSDAF